ncbi:MAG: hypothetical protein DMF99_27525 [Acidobacteria bacterium]|nr:MAG: hypothetical protein DMF99_27525 [Acidobacteriota bacterium]
MRREERINVGRTDTGEINVVIGVAPRGEMLGHLAIPGDRRWGEPARRQRDGVRLNDLGGYLFIRNA